MSFEGIKPSIFTTSEAGEFNIQNSDLMVEQHKKIYFMIDGNKVFDAGDKGWTKDLKTG